MSVRLAHIPDHDRCIRQARDDLLAIGREAECLDPGARRFDRLDLLLVSQPEDANDPPRRVESTRCRRRWPAHPEKTPGIARRTRGSRSRGARGPSGCRARRSCSRRSRNRRQLPAWNRLARTSLTIARLRPSGANSHALRRCRSARFLEAPVAAGDVHDLHPTLADQGDRPAIAREDGPVDVVQAAAVPMRGNFSSFGWAMGRSFPVETSQRRREPSPNAAITEEPSPLERHTPQNVRSPSPSTGQV